MENKLQELSMQQQQNQYDSNNTESMHLHVNKLQREKNELEVTLKEECINSEKMRAHIEWLTDIAENRLKSIGFISTIEECGDKRIDVLRYLIETRQELQECNKKNED